MDSEATYIAYDTATSAVRSVPLSPRAVAFFHAQLSCTSTTPHDADDDEFLCDENPPKNADIRLFAAFFTYRKSHPCDNLKSFHSLAKTRRRRYTKERLSLFASQ